MAAASAAPSARPNAPEGPAPAPSRAAVVAFVVALGAAAAVVTIAVSPLPAPAAPVWWTLPVLGLLLVAATWLIVPFRYGASVDAINLVEAALAPLLLAYPPLVVISVVALSQVVNGVLRRLPAIKTAFNTAMWSLAAGLGAIVVSAVGTAALWPDRVLGLLAALAVIGVVNNTAFAVVLTLSERDPLPKITARFLPVVRLAWLGGWVVNAALGLLFALTYLAVPLAAPLFAVPLLVLHLGYRSYSAARADQALLVAAHAAAAHLATPLYPLSGVPRFLAEVAECFEATAAELVLCDETGGRDIHRVERPSGRYDLRRETEQTGSLEAVVAATPRAVRTTAHGRDALARTVADAGVATCLAAPLQRGTRLIGALLVLDRGGFDGSDDGELAVLEALARETSGALSKGRLLADVLDERRRLAEIVEFTSDGILTLDTEGRVLTWNNALEHITGLDAEYVTGKGNVAARLVLRTVDGRGVDLGADVAALPRDVLITTASGATRHLACSYSAGVARADGAALVLIARDVTPADEHAALRQTMSEMVAAEAERRVVVEQLQEAVLPAALDFPGGTTAATYEPSDPSAPTGGDLYDWQLLPGGEVHIAVVDVLGHGVSATKDALAVIHTLRVVTAAGTPLESVVAQTDALLRAQQPDLVATVIVARYDPRTGRLRLVSGGHPPALIVTPRREVRQVAAAGGVIGWPGAGSDGVAETVLAPGDALVLYTDGLVEARRNILDGIDELERHAAEVATLPAADLSRELIRRVLAGADRRDDTLALVLRRDFVNAPDDRASWTIAPRAAAAHALRREVGDWLAAHGIAGDAPLITVAELLANAVRAARTRVSLHVSLFDDGVVVDVSDDGVADAEITGRGHSLPGDDAENGRGLYLVRTLSAHVDVLATAEGTTVRAVIAPTAAPAPEGGIPHPTRTAEAAGSEGA